MSLQSIIDNENKRQAEADKQRRRCPRCSSTDTSLVGDTKKAFSVSKAAAGGILLGPVGLIAGGLGTKGKHQFMCNKCGKIYTVKK